MLNRRQLFAFVAGTTFALSAPVTRGLEEGKFERTAFETDQAAGKPILLYVSAEWCETCQVQKEVINKLRADPNFRAYSIYTIDFDSEKDVVRSFGATSRSTLIVFKGKTEMGRLIGDTSEASIQALMEKGL
jgi:thioredoxin-like negative regulator of GroEL